MDDSQDRQVLGRRPMALGLRAAVKENDREEEAILDMQDILKVRRAKSDRSRRCDIMPAVK